MNTIAIILTVHNRKDKTLYCLQNILRQQKQGKYDISIFLTDDGCTDGTAEAIRSTYPNVIIIQGDGTLFWNRGMYKAWEKASQTKDFDYYLWLNDDTTLLPNALTGLLDESLKRPNSVIVGSTHSSSSPKETTYGGLFSGRIIQPNGFLQKCQTFNGNIVLIPKSIFHQIGNLDWTYQHAIGDLDYGFMCTRAGKEIYVSSEFRGICDRNSLPPKWIRPDVPFKERWNNFYSPLGYGQPGPFFYYNKKHFGMLRAIKIYISNHFRLFFPWIG